MDSVSREPLQVFISYAHEDEDLCNEFIKHLSQLQRDGLVRDWHDRDITGGSEWAGQIDEHLNSADIIVLLVSPDFLASEYCYDVEMKHALERDRTRQARVVPVILRPSDWKTSLFARLKALPKDGKPVVDWPTPNPEVHDHGFLDVVEGLRAIALEFRKPAESAAPMEGRLLPAPPHRLQLRPWHWAIAGGVLLLMAAAGWFWWASHLRRERVRQFVAQGDDQLKVGRYEEARQPYQQALRLSAGDAAASTGLQIVELAKIRPDAVAFERRLNQLLKETPRDPYLKVLEGDYRVGLRQPDEAMSRYEQAVKLNPGLAEAYFRMGALYDQRGNLTRALAMYKRAFDLAPSSPHYADNLADQYFKHGEYKEAISVYEGIRQFPLAALESAKIYRLLGELKEAAEQERIAIDWLGQPAVVNAPENQFPWSLDHGEGQPLSLPSVGEKQCYAHLELSATLYLDDNEPQAKGYAEIAAQACGVRSRAVKAVMRWELQRLAREQSDLAGRVAAYSRKFLAE